MVTSHSIKNILIIFSPLPIVYSFDVIKRSCFVSRQYGINAAHLDHSIPVTFAVVPAAQNEQCRKNDRQESNSSSPETQIPTTNLNSIFVLSFALCVHTQYTGAPKVLNYNHCTKGEIISGGSIINSHILRNDQRLCIWCKDNLSI